MPQVAGAAPVTDTSALTEAVTVEGVLEHMEAFQAIADANGGTREASTPGYTASADYVAELMEAAGYEVTRQEFEYNYFEELDPHARRHLCRLPLHLRGGQRHRHDGLLGHRAFRGVVQEVDVIVPLPVGEADSTTDSGCEPEDFAGFTGDIALIQRGTCDFSVKIANAVDAGATP